MRLFALLHLVLVACCYAAPANASVNGCTNNVGEENLNKDCHDRLCGDPISVPYGQVYDNIVDFTRAGLAGLDFAFVRTQVETSVNDSGYPTPFSGPDIFKAAAWRHNLQITVAHTSDPADSASWSYIVLGPTGKWYPFLDTGPLSDGECLTKNSSSDPTNFTQLCVTTVNLATGRPDGFTWRRGDGLTYLIDSLSSGNNYRWFVTRISDPHGNQISITYLDSPIGCGLQTPRAEDIYVHQVATSRGELLEFHYEKFSRRETPCLCDPAASAIANIGETPPIDTCDNTCPGFSTCDPNSCPDQGGGFCNTFVDRCRLTSVVAQPGPSETLLVSYDYDANGMLWRAIRPDGSREVYTYDFDACSVTAPIKEIRQNSSDDGISVLRARYTRLDPEAEVARMQTRNEDLKFQRFEDPETKTGCTWVQDLRVRPAALDCAILHLSSSCNNGPDDCGASGFACVQGRCVALGERPFCLTSSECPAGKVCHQFECWDPVDLPCGQPVPLGCARYDWQGHGPGDWSNDQRVLTKVLVPNTDSCSLCPEVAAYVRNPDLTSVAERDRSGRWTTHLTDPTHGIVLERTVNDLDSSCQPDSDPLNPLPAPGVCPEDPRLERYTYHPVHWQLQTSAERPSQLAPGSVAYTIWDFDPPAAQALSDASINCTNTPADFNITPSSLVHRSIEIGLTQGIHDTAPTCQVRITHYSYDSLGRLTGTTGPADGQQRAVLYFSDAAALPNRSLPSHLQTSTGFSSLVSTVDAYDGYGRAIQTTDDAGLQTSTTYDWAGRPTSIAIGTIPPTTLAYRPDGSLSAITHPTGVSRALVYDDTTSQLGLLTSIDTTYDSAPSSKTLFTYTAGNSNQATNLIKRVEMWPVDSAGVPAGPTPSRAVEFAYDAAGRRAVVKRFRSDSQTPSGVFQLDFDVAGRLVSSQDEVHATPNVHYTYDRFGRMTRIDRRSGGLYDSASGVFTGGTMSTIADFHYGPSPSVSVVTSGGGVTTALPTDDFGRRLGRESEDTGTRAYEYDVSSNIITTAQGRGPTVTNVVERTFDSAARLLQVTSAGAVLATYTYDTQTLSAVPDCVDGAQLVQTNLNGRLASAHDSSSGTRHLSYDTNGALVFEAVIRDWAPGCAWTTHWTYDAVGRMTTIRYATGLLVAYSYTGDRVTAINVGDPPAAFVTAVEYDAAGRMSRLTFSWGATLEFDRYLDGSPETAKLVKGGTTLWGQSVPPAGADGLGRPTRINDLVNPRLDRIFGYDELSRLVLADAPGGDESGSAFRRWQFEYDEDGNRTAMKEGGLCDLGYRYDHEPVSTRVSGWRHSTGATGSLGCRYEYEYDAAGRVVRIFQPCTCCGSTCEVDASGSCSPTDVHQFEYDVHGRMTRNTSQSGSWDYSYDHRGQRTRTSNGLASVDFSYGHDSQLFVELRYASASALHPRPLYEYIWLGSRILGVATSAMEASGAISERRILSVASDHLATPWAVVDPNYVDSEMTIPAPVAVWKAAYDPFGAVFTNEWEAYDVAPAIVGTPGVAAAFNVTRPPLARGLQLRFTGLDLPNGCEWVKVVNKDTLGVEACYTGTGANSAGTFWTPEFSARAVLLEHVVQCGLPASCPSNTRQAPGEEGSCAGSTCGGFSISEARAVYVDELDLRLRFAGQYDDGGLHYNRARIYDPLPLGSYLQPDPDRSYLVDAAVKSSFAYAQHLPTMYVDPTGRDAVVLPLLVTGKLAIEVAAVVGAGAAAGATAGVVSRDYPAAAAFSAYLSGNLGVTRYLNPRMTSDDDPFDGIELPEGYERPVPLDETVALTEAQPPPPDVNKDFNDKKFACAACIAACETAYKCTHFNKAVYATCLVKCIPVCGLSLFASDNYSNLR